MMNQLGDVSDEAAMLFVDNPRLWEGLPSQTNRYDDNFAGPRGAEAMRLGILNAHGPDVRVIMAAPASLSLPTSYTLNATAPSEFDCFTPIHPVEINSEFASALALCVGSSLAPSTIIHPEGGPISYRGCVVSTQNLTDAHVAIANHILNQCGRSANDAETTVFVYMLRRQIDYYVVDHKSKAIIWAGGQVPESFKGATRAKHEHEYWVHMENFPGPRFSTPEHLQSLKQALASNAIDALKSEGTTSPMSVQQIQTHLKSLEAFSSSGDIQQTYAVARLWNLILQSRAINKYGTPDARLDRFISIADNPPAFAGTYASILRLMFKRPHAHLGRCSRAWADRIAYTEEWKRYKTTDEREWEKIPSLVGLIRASEDLRKRGFKDLTGQLDLGGEFPMVIGGSGEIYLMTMLSTRAPVTAKIPRWTAGLTDDDKVKSLKNALHESLIRSMCQHPNIHQLLGVAEYRDRFAPISPLRVNGDLSQFCSRGSYSQARLYEICLQIWTGVAFLHELGIAHGDIKARNILVSDNFTIEITDFGNARHIGGRWDSLISEHVWQPSLRWASHEMLEENPKPTVQGDVHSTGMTMHEVTSGSVPYAGISDSRVFVNIMRGVLPPRPGTPSQIRNTQEDLFWSLLTRCWAYDAEQRPTAAAVRDQMRLITLQAPAMLGLYA